MWCAPPRLVSGLLPIGAWALPLTAGLSAGATLVAVSTLTAARWIAWTTASLISQMPSARVWTHRTVGMTGVTSYSAAVDEVDLSAGTAPAPDVPPRHPLRDLKLTGFGVRHTDGAVAVRDVDLTVTRGQLVLVVGPVGSASPHCGCPGPASPPTPVCHLELPRPVTAASSSCPPQVGTAVTAPVLSGSVLKHQPRLPVLHGDSGDARPARLRPGGHRVGWAIIGTGHPALRWRCRSWRWPVRCTATPNW